MWYWGENGRQHQGRCIVVGADNEYVPSILGYETARHHDRTPSAWPRRPPPKTPPSPASASAPMVMVEVKADPPPPAIAVGGGASENSPEQAASGDEA